MLFVFSQPSLLTDKLDKRLHGAVTCSGPATTVSLENLVALIFGGLGNKKDFGEDLI